MRRLRIALHLDLPDLVEHMCGDVQSVWCAAKVVIDCGPNVGFEWLHDFLPSFVPRRYRLPTVTSSPIRPLTPWASSWKPRDSITWRAAKPMNCLTRSALTA